MLGAVVGLVGLAIPAWFIGVHCFSVRGRPVERSAELRRVTADVTGYFRSPATTYLTLPARYTVYSAEEYASFVKSRAPSRFPYFAAVGQSWRYYKGACRATKRVYPFDPGAHARLGIGALSFSMENAVKGTYENTVGVVAEGVGFYHTDEDVFARKTAREYADFVRAAPWYDFPFGSKLIGLWKDTSLWGPDPARKWERRLVLSGEYAVKASYGRLVRWSRGRPDRPEDLVIHAWIDDAPERIFADNRIQKVKTVAPHSFIVTVPRSEAFTQIVTALAKQGVRFRDVAGNDDILVTAIAPRAWDYRLAIGGVLLSEEILTNPAAKRIAVRAPVSGLPAILTELNRGGASLEHFHPY